MLSKIRSSTGALVASFIFAFLLFAIGNIVHSPAVEAADCNPGLINSTAAYYNVVVQVRIENPDGSFRKWSNDFTINVRSTNPAPYGASTIPVDTAVNWAGKPGFPNGNANFRAQAGGEGTLQCPQLIGGNSTKLAFGNSIDGFPYLACQWGTWTLGQGKEHGVGFTFTPVGIGDAGAPGYWRADQAYGLTTAAQGGGLIDVNNVNDDFTFTYRLTRDPDNPPQGNLEEANCTNGITGWARDIDAPGGITDVHLYFDDPSNPNLGINLGPTSIYRPDPSLQGNFGFNIDATDSRIPVDIFSSSHTVYAYVIGVGPDYGNPQLSNSPRTIGPCTPRSSNTSSSPGVDIGDDENPTTAIFTGSIDQADPNYSVNVTRKFYIIRANDPTGVSPVTLSPDQTFAQTGPNSALSVVTVTGLRGAPHNLAVGDQVCTSITIDRPTVTIGYRGGITVPANSTPDVQVACERFVNKPYVTSFGSDLKAGGGVGTCTNAPAPIATYRRGALGSNTQLAAFALGTIQGITSARFADSAATANPTQNGLTAQNFGSYASCAHDFYGDKEPSAPNWSTVYVNASQQPIIPDTTTPNPNDGDVAEGKFNATGGTSLPAMTIARGQQIYIYVDGDVSIGGNISMDTGPWSDRSDIPVLYVIASGNIAIAPGVTNIAGVFVAQGVRAYINTCSVLTPKVTAPPTAPASDEYKLNAASLTAMYNSCNSQLIVDGAFVANKVILGRASGSLRDSTATEDPFGTPQAAEVFRYNPGVYLGRSPRPNIEEETTDNGFESITNLPPVL